MRLTALGMFVAAILIASGVAQQPTQPTSKFQQMVADAKRNIQETPVEEVKTRLDRKEKFLLLDVREDNEWSAGHIREAVHVSRGLLEKGIGPVAPNSNTPIVVYCHSGARSALATDTLQKMGYKNVKSMSGGIAAWQAKGYAVEK
jgi:rhodanese-related sulfurtransferase